MPTQWSEAEQVPLGCIVPHTAQRCHFSFHASGGLFSFSSERKEEKKRRQKLRFWISLRGFTWFLLCLFLPRERCAMQISSKYCIVSASLFAFRCRFCSEMQGCAVLYLVCRGGVLPRPTWTYTQGGDEVIAPYERLSAAKRFHNGGQRPPPTFAALRQRRDLIIAPPGGCFQRGRARTDRKPSERKIV